MKKQLRPYQVRAIEQVKDSIRRGNRKLILQIPTGGGKTLIASNIIESALAKGKRVMFCVNAIELVDQTVRAFVSEGIRSVGVIQAAHEMTNGSMPVQVCSIQTLAKRKLPDADLVIIDEAHNLYKFHEEWMKRWDAVPFIGLTATPWTKGLGKHYQDLIIATTTQELIETGYLSDFRVYAPSHPDLSGVKIRAGDYAEEQLAEVMNDSVLVSDVVSTWKARGENRPTLCFCVDRAHAKHVQERFKAAGVPAGYVDAYTERAERDEIRNKFHDGEIKVVCNVGVLVTGVDWDVRCIILARPTKSEMLFVQIIGRGLRTANGKDDCIVLDHSDTHLRLGFVTDIHHEALDDGTERKNAKREPVERLPKECPSCAFLKPAKVHECPACGFKPEKVTDVEAAAGQLDELKRKKKENKRAKPEDKERFYGELLSYCRQYNKKTGYAAHLYKSMYGVWPNKYKHATLLEVSEETLKFIKHSMIKSARSKSNAN